MGNPHVGNLRPPAQLTSDLWKRLSCRNRTIITAYLEHKRASGQVREKRERKLRWLVVRLAYWLRKDFDRAGVEDLKRLVTSIDREPFKDATKRDYKIALKNLYKVTEGEDDFVPPKIRWLRIRKGRPGEDAPELWIPEDEVRAMVEATSHTRDKAFVFGLYESGCRIDEFRNLRWENVAFTDDGTVRLTVIGKTGRRTIPVVACVPLLAAWREQHPAGKDPRAAVWSACDRSTPETPISYNRARDIVWDAAQLARRMFPERFKTSPDLIHPHLLRSSRATDCANRGWGEAQMCVYFGWRFGSTMPAIYIRRAGVDVSTRVLQDNGMAAPREKTASVLAPRRCYRCRISNAATARFCSGCGAILDLAAAQDLLATKKASEYALAEGPGNMERRLDRLEKLMRMRSLVRA